MNLLQALPLKVKLPLIIVGLGLAVAGTLQVVNIVEIQQMMADEVAQEFESTVVMQETAVKNWLHGSQAALLGLAASPATMAAIQTMGRAWSELPDAGGVLQKAYITDNPNPIGKKGDLLRAEGQQGYHMLHSTYHAYFARMVSLEQFYDVFLIDPRGNIIYTFAKEADFASNLQTGPYASSNLGLMVKAAVEGQSGITYFSDFDEYAPSNNAPAAFIATQVLDQDGKMIGVIAAQLNGGILSALLEDPLRITEVYLVGADGQTRSAGTEAGDRGFLANLPDLPQVKAAAAGEAGFFADVMLPDGDIGFARTHPLDMGGIRWGLVVERDRAEVMAPVNRLMVEIALISAGLAALLLGLGHYFACSVTRPIGRIGATMDAIANGNLEVSIVDADRPDEIGGIALSLRALLDKLVVAKLAEHQREVMQADLRLVVESLRSGMNNLAGGDLSQPIDEVFPAVYEALRGDFNRTLAVLSDTICQVVDASESIRARSTEISSASEDLSHRTENQAAALEETAAALDELTVSVKSAAESALEVENIVRQARKDAEDSGIVVQGAVAAMAEIEKSSEQISQIIGAIDDIAFQTNLLALNAGVEAARAGDAGKGFAVVASEVRALAQRSSAAAKEIKTLISASAQHVGRGVDQVGKAGEALHSIVGSVANVSSLVSTIAAGAAEQSTGLAEINIGVIQLDQVTQQNAAMVEQSTAASHMLHQDASDLAQLVARFRLGAAVKTGIETQGRGDHVEIALSKFVPSGFASSETLAAESLVEKPPKPARAAAGHGRAIWQEF